MKKFLIILITVLSFLSFFSIVYIYNLLHTVSIKTNTDLLYFPRLLNLAYESPSISPGFNFILLGLDPRDDDLEKSLTTDTIILGNLSHNLHIKLISIPRDLWDYTLNTKINQIYPLSLNTPDKYQFIQQNYSRLTAQNVDRTLIITTQNLIDLVKLVGGVDLVLEQGFTDNQYPNSEYIINPSPDVPKFITISFPSGPIHLDENNITPFVRSRKSTATAANGGTDIGRIHRQQLLIDALLNRIRSPEILNDPNTIITLYNFWKTNLLTNFSDLDIASLAIKLGRKTNQIAISKIVIPSGEDPKTDIIYHPKSFINKQWVFIPQDVQYTSFKQFIKEAFDEQN